MNTRLLFCLLWLTPLLCQGASFTSYFYNVEAITNVTARSAVNGLTARFTNSLSAAGFDTLGTTNATLIGNLRANGATFTNGITAGASTFTGAVSHPNGTIALPSVTFTSDTGSGLSFVNTGLATSAGGSIGTFLQVNTTKGLALRSTIPLSWGSTTAINTDAADLFLFRDSANTLQIGTDSATPAAQTIKGADGSGSNIAGGAVRHDGGYSTGTAAGGPVIIRTVNSAGATSSSLNTSSERFHAIAKWVTLTSATATTIFTVPVPATNYVGLTATVTIYATDGTDHQSKTSVITCDAINKAGAITETLSQVDNTTATSSGTLTATYDSVDAGSNVLGIRVAADSSLSETVLRAKIVITAINSNGSAAVTEQ